MLEDGPERGLGPALAWALRQEPTALHVLAERETGLLARRAEAFAFPIGVWHVDERTLLPGVAEPIMAPTAPRPEHVALMPTIEIGGAQPVVEHGVVLGEVRGLEVCRVVDDVATGAVRLEVGVGAHDREAFAIMHGDVPTESALRGVVERGHDVSRAWSGRSSASTAGPRAAPAVAAHRGPEPHRSGVAGSDRAAAAPSERQGPLSRRRPWGSRPTASRSSWCARSAWTSTWCRTRRTPGSPPPGRRRRRVGRPCGVVGGSRSRSDGDHERLDRPVSRADAAGHRTGLGLLTFRPGRSRGSRLGRLDDGRRRGGGGSGVHAIWRFSGSGAGATVTVRRPWG